MAIKNRALILSTLPGAPPTSMADLWWLWGRTGVYVENTTGGLPMRKLIPVRQLLEDAEERGVDTDFMLVDPADICSVDPDELPIDSEQNPESEIPD